MANPLKELELSVYGFQFIQELPIEAPPARVWTSLANVNAWARFGPDAAQAPKSTLELWPGGRWLLETKDGTQNLFGMVTLVEPNKLLRLQGQMAMTHLPINTVVIFELQPQKDGRTTLLRLGQRTFGYMEADLEKRVKGGWGNLLPSLKKLAENQ